MELDYVVLADVVSPRPDGKIDLHGIGWDTILAASTPVTHPRMDLAMRFLVSAQEVEVPHRVVVTLMGEDGELGRLQADVPPLTDDQRAGIPAGRRVGIGMVLTFGGTTFPQFGAYHLAITWDGTEVREPIRLFVTPLPQQPFPLQPFPQHPPR